LRTGSKYKTTDPDEEEKGLSRFPFILNIFIHHIKNKENIKKRKIKAKNILKEYAILTIGICGKEMLLWLYKA
jgi:hypothetical protein